MPIPLQAGPVRRTLLVRLSADRQVGTFNIRKEGVDGEKGIMPAACGVGPSYTLPDPLCGPFGLCVPHVLPWVTGRG